MRRTGRPCRGQALVEFALAAGGCLLLLAVAFALTPRSLLPAWLDEQAACALRSPSPGQDLDLLAQAHRGGALSHPRGGRFQRMGLREAAVSPLRLLLPRELFPGRTREAEVDAPILPLSGARSAEAAMGLTPGGTRVARRLKMAVLREVRPEEVRRLVEKAFLGGLADRAGLLEPLRRLGLDVVRVELNALPEGR